MMEKYIYVETETSGRALAVVILSFALRLLLSRSSPLLADALREGREFFGRGDAPLGGAEGSDGGHGRHGERDVLPDVHSNRGRGVRAFSTLSLSLSLSIFSLRSEKDQKIVDRRDQMTEK